MFKVQFTILIKITLDKDINVDSRNDSVLTTINQAKKTTKKKKKTKKKQQHRNRQYYDKSIELHK